MDTTADFPLITLQPATNIKQAWVALLLASERPLVNAELARVLHGFGLAEILGQLPCMVTVDPLQIGPDLAATLPRDTLVLNMPAAVATDPACHERLAALRAAGFRLMAAGLPAPGAVLPEAVSSLAVVCPGHAMPAGLSEWLDRLPGPHLALGATDEVCPGFCRFHWLTGHLSRHAPPVRKGDPTTRALLLRLLGLISADADDDELEALIKHDHHLAYQLLKLVNSVALAPGRKISSFAQAIVLLGRRQLQRWLQLLLYARQPGSEGPSPLLPRAAMRAALMEGLARCQQLPHAEQDQAFMVGIFSLLDLLFAEPLEQIIRPLNLADAIERALVAGEGRFGTLLKLAVAAERPPASELAAGLAAAGITREDWATALLTAGRWAARVSAEA